MTALFDNMNLVNEMIDNANPKAKSIDESILEIIKSLHELEQNLIKAIQNSITNEKLLEICLGGNEDLNRVFARFEKLQIGTQPEKFVSFFLEQNTQFASNVKAKVEIVQSNEAFDFVDSKNIDTGFYKKEVEIKPNQQKKKEDKLIDLDDIFSNVNVNESNSININQVNNKASQGIFQSGGFNNNNNQNQQGFVQENFQFNQNNNMNNQGVNYNQGNPDFGFNNNGNVNQVNQGGFQEGVINPLVGRYQNPQNFNFEQNPQNNLNANIVQSKNNIVGFDQANNLGQGNSGFVGFNQNSNQNMQFVNNSQSQIKANMDNDSNSGVKQFVPMVNQPNIAPKTISDTLNSIYDIYQNPVNKSDGGFEYPKL